jgi:hypothetical protein
MILDETDIEALVLGGAFLGGGGVRLAAFPDLITTFDARDGTPRTSADLERGADMIILCLPQSRLILGAGMRVMAHFCAVEEALNQPILRYVFKD